jgi:GT2 family glycosyltransferase
MRAEPVGVSVIIPTVDRASPLVRLLDSLRWQTHPRFEVVVVVGPTRDDTVDRVVAAGLPVKLVHCPARNLSMARNTGIAAAAGEFVAFIDDDAVAEPNWLEELLVPFARPDVAAVGGWVFDRTGLELQYPTMLATRLGATRPVAGGHRSDERCFPCSWEFPYAPGGNAAYRRQVLIDLGMFDEEIEYYLDETDVSARLIDRGWIVTSVSGAAIHHKHLPSDVRGDGDVLRDLYPIVKNRAYFAFKHATGRTTEDEIIAATAAFRDELLATTRSQAAAGGAPAGELAALERRVAPAIDDGRRAAMATRPAPQAGGSPPPFVPYPGRGDMDDLRCRAIVTSHPLGPMTAEPSRVELRVIEPGDRPSVEFVDGVWRHTVVGNGDELLAEVRRLRRYRHLDEVVGGPAGDDVAAMTADVAGAVRS